MIKDSYDEPELARADRRGVGIGALKYGDLSVARNSSYVLDFDRLLALTGNTGPYLQYAAARIRSIFARAGLSPEAATGPIVLGEPAERALALRLLGFGAAVEETAENAEPHKLAGFLFDIGERLHDLLRAVPGPEGRQRGDQELPAGAGRAHAEGAAERA